LRGKQERENAAPLHAAFCDANSRRAGRRGVRRELPPTLRGAVCGAKRSAAPGRDFAAQQNAGVASLRAGDVAK
jgi:hypothetical protein